MTSDESTWLWWLLLWGTEGAVFRKAGGASGHATDTPLEYSNLKQEIKDHPTGGINHQNTCGHGFSWRESFRFVETHEHGYKGRMLPPARMSEGVASNRTLLGASPAEIAFRDYDDRQRRWSSE